MNLCCFCWCRCCCVKVKTSAVAFSYKSEIFNRQKSQQLGAALPEDIFNGAEIIYWLFEERADLKNVVVCVSFGIRRQWRSIWVNKICHKKNA